MARPRTWGGRGRVGGGPGATGSVPGVHGPGAGTAGAATKMPELQKTTAHKGTVVRGAWPDRFVPRPEPRPLCAWLGHGEGDSRERPSIQTVA